MKRIILKGILWYTTCIATLLLIIGIDSIIDKGYFIPWLVVAVILIYNCYKHISYRELYVISLSEWFDNKLKK